MSGAVPRAPSSGRAYGAGWPLARLWRAFHVEDRASSTMVSFIVGAAVFMVSTTVLIHFVVQPPGTTSGLEEHDLKMRASEALEVLLGTAGFPTAWSTSASSIDEVERLGLLDAGSSIRMDPLKFDAIAKGKYTNPSSTNGAIDYEEAKRALGLSGYDFHLRASPVFDAFKAGSYGVEGMETYHVGYIGDWESGLETAASKSERHGLSQLPVKYSNATRSSLLGTGDAFKDDSSHLRSVLVPLLGSQPAQTVLSGATPSCQFYMVDAAKYKSFFKTSVQPSLTRALALADANGNPCYSKNSELRAVLGVANMESLSTATLTWKEWVDTNWSTTASELDDGDYGWVEVSPNGGATWYRLTDTTDALTGRSQDKSGDAQPEPAHWDARTVVISSLNCAPCVNAPEVHVAFRWVADNDDVKGKGWIVDDVQLSPTTSTGFHKTFEKPEYDLLVIGSNVGQTAFTAAEVKYAIRDFVTVHGGRIVVLGGQTNTQWLEPIFKVGIRDASPGVSSPDSTHPLLTVPNELDWMEYKNNGKAWDFSGQSSSELFNMVVGAGPEKHVLSVSKAGAFSANGQEGVVMLTTYLPYLMEGDQPLRFLANTLTYGRYHYLYMDFGPEVPRDVPVASATRTAIMDKTRATGESYVEVSLVLYVWRGSPTTAVSSGIARPAAPHGLALAPADKSVTLTWSEPGAGTSPITSYHLYRGTAPGTTAYLDTIGTNRTYVDLTVENGVTYYYNVTAANAHGQGASSLIASATPSKAPTPPQALTAAGSGGSVVLSWTQPSSNGGSTVTGYNVHRNVTGNLGVINGTPYAQLGNVLSWTDTNVQPLVTYAYQVKAVNARGAGDGSNVAQASLTAVPSAPVVTAQGGHQQIALTWSPPLSNGANITHYSIYASLGSGTTEWIANSSTPSFTETGLGEGVTRYYRVAAVNANGVGAQSLEVSATTLVMPSAPASVVVTKGSGPGNLTLTWSPPLSTGTATMTGYVVYAGDGSGALSQVADLDGVNTLTWTETNLGNARLRYYQVAAKTAEGGVGARSPETTGTTYAVRLAPTLTVVPGPAVGQATLTITPAAELDQLPIRWYTVYYSSPNGLPSTIAWRFNTTSTYAIVSGLNIQAAYWWQAGVVTDAGEGVLSPAQQVSSM